MVADLFEVEFADEVRRFVVRRRFGAVEPDPRRIFFQPGPVEDVAQAHALPAGAAHGAAAPLDTARRGFERGTAVAAALKHGVDFDRLVVVFEVGDGDGHLPFDQAVDLDAKFVDVDVRRDVRHVPADEEHIVRGDRFGENGARRFQQRGTVGIGDERLLLREGDRGDFTVVDRLPGSEGIGSEGGDAGTGNRPFEESSAFHIR